MKYSLFCKFFLFTITFSAWAQVDWSQNAEVNGSRENIYGLGPASFQKLVDQGKRVALFYPVTVSDLLIPYRPLKTFFESDPDDPVRKLIFSITRSISPFKSMEDAYEWLGVHHFPLSTQAENPNPLPTLTATEQALPMGATLIETKDGEALTFGCAACHAADLFGVKVLGLTNRFPRANEFFRNGDELAPYVNTFLLRDLLKTTEGERLMMVNVKNAVKWVKVKKPQALGLDTSLAQVALSLAHRKEDAYATRDNTYHSPRRNKLEKMVADSKPSVWWNVKYKTRWLSDGSVISGNPIHTNFLWNEIGRGTDLKRLEAWMVDNKDTIKALTAAVFATKAPEYVKFFGEKSINIEMAQEGEKHFIKSCQRCHGQYEKDWSKSWATTKITYHKRTPVIDVGTDPGRYLGMNEFAKDLNRLAISKTIGTVVVPQKGYVPPPLVGIWSRWPYFHNNSAPNLCAVLTKSTERPKLYYSGKALDKERDFDQDCVGYPLGERTPTNWKTKEHLYDTKLEGLSNKGHDEGIFLNHGMEIYSAKEKREIIEFLKTL